VKRGKPPKAERKAPGSAPSGRRVSFGFLIFTVLLTGCGVIMLEMLGARIAGPVFGVSLYIWTALIAVTLISLSLGYWLGGVLSDRRPQADVMYGLILASGLVIAFLPWLNGPVLAGCYRALGLRLGLLAGAFALFAPPLTLLGMVSPFAIKLALADLERAGKTAGALYALSTVGSVAGAVLTGYFLIPVIGVSRTLLVVTAVILTPPAIWFALGRRWGALAGAGMVLFLGAVTAVARPGRAPLTENVVVVDSRDSLYGQIKVIDRYSDRGSIRWLLLEGTSQTGVYLDSNELVSNYAIVMADFLRFHPPPGKRALLVGLGGGALLRPLSAAGFQVDVVEIDPLVAQVAAQYFGCKPEGYRLICEDGRAYIRRTDQRYDAILFDVFSGGGQPFHLFSREAFEETRRVLAPGGVVGVNVIAFPRGPRQAMAASLHRTLSSVFPHGRVFVSYPEDPAEDLNNILMFFSEAAFAEPDPASMSPKDAEEWDWLCRGRISYGPQEGVLVTDDWNPVDRWTAQVNEAWRERIFQDLGPEILTY